MGAPRDRARPWRARYVEAVPIRALGAIEYVACRAKVGGERRVLVAASPAGATEETSALLAEIARVHQLLDHPRIPRVVDAGPSHVALACDAVVDLETLSALVAETRHTVDLGGASAFAIALLEVLLDAHRVVDPETGAPVCVGAFATTNVLVSPTGDFWLVGWGHPWAGAARAKLFAGTPASHVAPETVFGVAPQPGSDLTAATAFFHSFRSLGEFPPEVVKAIGAAASSAVSGAGEHAEIVAALMLNAQATRPEDRSIPRFIADFKKALGLFHIAEDFDLFRRDVVRLLERKAVAPSAATLLVATDGGWCQAPASPVVRLERRGALRRMVLALAAARRDSPGTPLSWEALLAVGWPGESPRVESAKNRVYVAVASLRSMGLRDVLLSQDAGYCFDAKVNLAWSDEAPPP